MVPSAGTIAIVWLGVGGILFLVLFANRARMTDAARTARDPELLTLRGRTPLVLVPIANPVNAEAMISLADALVPAEVGRVLAQTVVVVPGKWRPEDSLASVEQSQDVIGELLSVAVRLGIRVEVITTVAEQPMREIARVARLHRCESVLMGLSQISSDRDGTHLESLLGELDANVVILRSRVDWRLADATKVLVPVAGRGGHERLLALLVGSLLRKAERQVNFLRVLPTGANLDEVRRAKRELGRLVDDEVRERCDVSVVRSNDPVATVTEAAHESDLLILGVQRFGRRRKLFGSFTRTIAQRTSCPLIVLSRRG
jgi:nucleotide-binding universal stress UspA family protein